MKSLKKLEAELYKCRRHIQKLLEAQRVYEKEVERKARELSRARKILQDTLDTLEVGVLVIGTDFRIVFCNRALKDLFGASGEVEGKFCWEVLQGRDAPCASGACRKALESSERTEEELVFLKDGRKRIFLVRTHPWRFEGKTAGVVRSFIDITDRKLAEEYEIFSGVSAYMAHVVKNSITPIGGLVKRLSRRYEDERDVFKHILRSLFRLERSIFEYESYVKTKKRTSYKVYNALEVLKDFEKDLKENQFTKKFYLEHLRDRFEVSLSFSQNFCAVLLGDPDLLGLAIRHLASTIVGYGVEEIGVETRLEITAEAGEKELRINFKYNYSIPERLLEFITEPWKEERGTGFERWGFAIASEVCSFHGGRLGVGNSECRMLIPLIDKRLAGC